MPVPTMPIIGVVGMTKDVQEDVTRLAEETGRAVVSQGCILLTGGKPGRVAADPLRRPVKDAALDGAVSAGAAGTPARLIGVLPNQPRADAVVTQFNAKAFGLLVWTRLTSNQRNYLTGRLPDGVIALKGGVGTLSEIGLAHHAGRPVVFLDSLDYLQTQFRSQTEAVRAVFKEVEDVFQGPAADEALDSLGALLDGNKTPVRAASPAEAVHAVRDAVAHGGVTRSLATAFPCIKDCTVSGDFFEKQVQSLYR